MGSYVLSFFLSFFSFLPLCFVKKKKKDKDDLLLLLFLHEYKTISALLSSIKCLSLSLSLQSALKQKRREGAKVAVRKCKLL